MDDPAPFQSLILSRPARRPALRRGFAIGCALGLHLLVLTACLIAPFLALELMQAPKASVSEPIRFVPPLTGKHAGGGGDGLPAPAARKGEGGSAHRSERPAAPRADAASLQAPLDPPDSPLSSDGTEGAEPGDPNGVDDGTGNRPGGCPDCIGRGEERGPGDPGDGGEEIYAWTPGVTSPELIPGTRALPKYPDLARRARVQASVILLIMIETDGRVGEVQVIRSADQRFGFDLAAIEAVKQWRYRPASMHGRRVAVYASVIIEFTLSR